jgi:hypothetical protein
MCRLHEFRIIGSRLIVGRPHSGIAIFGTLWVDRLHGFEAIARLRLPLTASARRE